MAGTKDDSAEIFLLPVFSTGGHYDPFWHTQGCPLIDVVHAAVPLPSVASPILQDALKDGFGEAVVACDIPEPCKFSSLDSCQKRFLWTYKEVDFAQHRFVGLVLQVEDAEKLIFKVVLKQVPLSLIIIFENINSRRKRRRRRERRRRRGKEREHDAEEHK